MSEPARRRRLLRAAVTVFVTIALLFLVLRAIRPAELGETLSEISPGFAALAAVAAFGFIVVRLHVAVGHCPGDGNPVRLPGGQVRCRVDAGDVKGARRLHAGIGAVHPPDAKIHHLPPLRRSEFTRRIRSARNRS